MYTNVMTCAVTDVFCSAEVIWGNMKETSSGHVLNHCLNSLPFMPTPFRDNTIHFSLIDQLLLILKLCSWLERHVVEKKAHFGGLGLLFHLRAQLVHISACEICCGELLISPV